MSFPRYEKYKDSGVEWLGEVPEGWEVVQTRRIFEICKRIVGEEGFDVLSITQKGIRIKDTESGDGQLSADYSKYQLVEVGDFAMNHMDLLTGYVDVSPFYGVTSPDYRVFRLKDKTSESRYYLYLFQNAYKRKIFFPFGQGSSHLGRWRLPTDEFNAFQLPVPATEEQLTIAAFLDHETGKIDALVAEQEKLIGLLKEKRQAVISHAVTKGLDPNAKMKDSGVEWLGEVPEGWEVKQAKHCFVLQRGHDLSSDEMIDGEFPVYGSNGIIGWHNVYTTKAPSLTVGRSGSVGEINYIEEDFWAHNTSLFLKEAKGAPPRYLYYLLIAINPKRLSAGTAVGTLDRKNIHSQIVASPPQIEMEQIAAFLDHETAKIDTLIEEANKAIELMKERRTALISAAVTGKIDVRGWRQSN